MVVPGEHREEAMGTDVTFDDMVAGISRDFLNQERHLRHAAYDRFGTVVSALLPGNMTDETLHVHPVEIAENIGERTVFLCRDRVPDHGTLVRVIMNDEVHDPVGGGSSLYVSDFVVSIIQKTLTFQQNALERGKTDASWMIGQQAGPLLLRRSDRLEVGSGSDYSVHIPKTRGFPHKASTLVEQRLLLEVLNDNLSLLNGATAEPGYPSQAGIMS